MKQELMKALILLMQTTVERARKKGFDILLLLGGITVMAWWVLRTDAKMDALEIRHENKLERVSSEYAAALNATNRRLTDCERDKYDLSIRVAVLEYAQTKNKKR